MKTGILCVSILSLASTDPVRAGDICLEQPHDFVGFAPSEQGTAVPWARTADDFFVFERLAFFLQSVTVEMIVSFPNMPASFALEIHQGPLPTEPAHVRMFPTSVIDKGPWNGDPNLHLVEVTFPGGNQALGGPQRYWVSPYAIGNGSGTDRAWWGTAGNGAVHDNEGYFKSEHFGVPDWTPISQSGILDFPTDFAMTIEAKIIPAPGALAMAGLVARRRRRG